MTQYRRTTGFIKIEVCFFILKLTHFDNLTQKTQIHITQYLCVKLKTTISKILIAVTESSNPNAAMISLNTHVPGKIMIRR